MRFRCANRISIFLCSRREVSKLSMPARDVAGAPMNVARDFAKWDLRTALRSEFVAIAIAFSSQIDQRKSRHSPVSPSSSGSCPRDSGRHRQSDHIEIRCARRCHHSASTCRWAAGSDGETNLGTTSLAAPARIVEGRQILLHSAAGPRRIAISTPILTRDRALLVGVGLDQARIDCKAFASNQTGCDARLDDPFEHTAENISVAECSFRARENAE
jgi:hypothetical protein